MRHSTRTAVIGVALLLAGGVAHASPRPGSSEKTGGRPEERSKGALQFLHGTVITEGGKRYTGDLRWGDEEAFWDDLFNGNKEDLPYIDRQPVEDRPRHKIRVFGIFPVGYWEDEDPGRQFVARFGDIKEIRPRGGDVVDVVMKSGTKYRLEGGSNDIGAIIHIVDPASGNIEVSWGEIESVVFEPASSTRAESGAQRLFGDVVTEAGTFRGFIQWDSQECLWSDRLDGESEDGKVSLEMGRIRAIEKRTRNSSRVETKDGKTLDLSGTNDVNGSIRGILVEDERYGRVKVSWDVFRRVDFREPSGAGRGYDDYAPARALRGTVTDRDGKAWKGKIAFDLDESETWEMLDGHREGVEYSVPFERIRALEPVDEIAARVTLRNGQKLVLEESQDVTDRNAGVLVMKEGDKPEHYVPWDRIVRIEME